MFFRIFRYDPEGGVLRQTHILDRSFSLQETRRSFICRTHFYDGSENVYVLSGDYVVVYLPTLSPHLPVLGNNIPGMRVYEDKRHVTSFFSTTIYQSMLKVIEDTAFHVSAEISKYMTK